MRIRTVKPEFFTHPEILALSVPARLLLLSLLTQADDEGRLYDQPLKIGGLAFGEEDKANPKKLLQELADNGRILRYQVDDRACIQVLNFNEHQTISHPRDSLIPPADERTDREDCSPLAPGTFQESSGQERNGKEGNGKEVSSKAPNGVTEDQNYLANRLTETWGERGKLTFAAIQKLNNAYGVPAVSDAMRSLRGFPPQEAVRSVYAYIEAICQDRVTA